MINIIDYQIGNTKSIQYFLDRIGMKNQITNTIDDLKKSRAIILPGVGNFSRAIKFLESNKKLLEILENVKQEGNTPIIGICLGMQLMTSFSEEANSFGLGWVEAKTKLLRNKINNPSPNIGWRKISQAGTISENILQLNNTSVYFNHSYVVELEDRTLEVANMDFEGTRTAIFKKDNLLGFQFHPEKSYEQGEQIFQKMMDLYAL